MKEDWFNVLLDVGLVEVESNSGFEYSKMKFTPKGEEVREVISEDWFDSYIESIAK